MKTILGIVCFIAVLLPEPIVGPRTEDVRTNQKKVIRMTVNRYENEAGEFPLLPERGFRVAVEGVFIIGAVLGSNKLYPFVRLIDRRYDRVKMNKCNNRYVQISKDAPQLDRAHAKFFHAYTIENNLFYAKPTLVQAALLFLVDVIIETMPICLCRPKGDGPSQLDTVKNA